jgi:PRTRC genetic system protein C
MALVAKALKRVFVWNGTQLKDPDPALSPKEVRDVLAMAYPGITTAEIEGPDEKNGKLEYRFVKAVGTKG